MNIRTLLVGVTALLTAAAPSHIAAQAKDRPYPVFTADHFNLAMKTTGQAFAAVNSSLSKNDHADAKALLAISRDRLATTITFWRDRQKDDAVKMLRDALGRLDALDAALSASPVDTTLVAMRAKEAGAACQACHAVYREQDAATKTFKFKGVSE